MDASFTDLVWTAFRIDPETPAERPDSPVEWDAGAVADPSVCGRGLGCRLECGQSIVPLAVFTARSAEK